MLINIVVFALYLNKKWWGCGRVEMLESCQRIDGCVSHSTFQNLSRSAPAQLSQKETCVTLGSKECATSIRSKAQDDLLLMCRCKEMCERARTQKRVGLIISIQKKLICLSVSYCQPILSPTRILLLDYVSDKEILNQKV